MTLVQRLSRRVPLALALLAAAPAAAQERSVASLLAAAPATGRAQFAFPSRAGVCGDGRGYMDVGGTSVGETYVALDRHGASGRVAERPCVPGPVRVVLTLRDRRVERLRAYVGDTTAAPGDSGAAELGAADPVDAARWLLDLAARGDDGRVAERALLPAVLAARAEPWPALLAIARDSTGRPRSVRTTAVFWLARFAAAARDGRRNSLVTAEDADGGDDGARDVKGRAVFALTQLPHREGIPALLEVARDNRDPGVRAKAMFWLGQSGDPRAYAYFEEVLSGRR
jgi:hypothetical protein